ncbi:hypothetical protein SAMN05428959_101961 [Duganella sp. CF517]|uniref:hypothetical protein n=1 Tax=Duganella sp. CF517 TaxID=1881038 RepID=UPI0008C16220|nr:hypothetical protein [Duganella sp. CF517]SEN27276.1 hypothetical protein SAMN05428959_101961 [Duganella sp. CF517]
MALDFIGFAGDVLVRIVIEVFCYGTGRVVIPVLSLGAARVDKWNARRYVTAYKLWWREDGQLVFSGETAAFIGFVFWIAVIVALNVIV